MHRRIWRWNVSTHVICNWLFVVTKNSIHWSRRPLLVVVWFLTFTRLVISHRVGRRSSSFFSRSSLWLERRRPFKAVYRLQAPSKPLHNKMKKGLSPSNSIVLFAFLPSCYSICLVSEWTSSYRICTDPLWSTLSLFVLNDGPIIASMLRSSLRVCASVLRKMSTLSSLYVTRVYVCV